MNNNAETLRMKTKKNLYLSPYLKIPCIAILLMGLALSFCGCAQPYSAKPLSSIKLFRQRTENVLNSSKPGKDTQQYLRLKFLDKKYRKEPESVILELLRISRETKDAKAMIATAELSLLQAKKTFNSDRDTSAAMYINAAETAYDYLFASDAIVSFNTLKPSYRFMANIYNRAVSRLVEIREKNEKPWQGSSNFDLYGTSYEFTVKANGPGVWDPQIFDFFRPANQIHVKGFRNEYLTHGLGAPIIGFVDEPRQHAAFGKYSPRKGMAYPVTAILFFEPREEKNGKIHRKAHIRFYDPSLTNTAHIAGHQVPLEADFSTPLGVMLAKMQPPKVDLAGMFKSDEYLSQSGMYMLEPYRPDKIPVVMVHGLMSSPETWVEMFNDLKGDPELRSRFQFWFFRYPTGLPVMYSASLLRQELLDISAKYNPQADNNNFDNMVILGHSMGGLLSRMMVQNSENIYWDSVFAKPVNEISVDEQTRKLLKDIYFFERLPFVKRVIFLATPHRGSDLADQWFAKLGSGFVSLPSLVNDVGDAIFSLSKDELAIDPKDFAKEVPNAIDLLSPSSHFVKTTATVPLDTSILYHSIIGIRNSKYGPGSSDGIVPYKSSHLDITLSEKLVPTTHEAHKHPLAIDEVKRILKLHINPDFQSKP